MTESTNRDARLRRAGRAALRAAVALPLLLFAVAAFARPPHGPGGPDEHGPERFIERYADELGLAPETRAAIEKISEESRARSRELRRESAGDWEAFRALLEQPMPDPDEVIGRAEAMNDNRFAAKKNRLEAMLAIRALLTEEQRAKLVEIRKSDPRKHHGRGPFRACGADLDTVCTDTEPGRETLRCLADQWDELSEECRDSFERRAEMRRERGRWGRSPE